MSNWLGALFNNIKVTPLGGAFEISGIRTRPFFAEVKRVFSTTRFENGMVTNVTGSSFVVSRFFLYDFYNVVKGLQDYGTRYFRQEIIDKLESELSQLTEIERTVKHFPTKLHRSELKRFPVEPLPSQEEFFAVYDQKTQQYELNGYILAAPPGTGKATSNDTLVQIPGGWKRMGEIRIGDSVIAHDGTTTKVTGVYPQGKVKLHKVTFADGRTARVCGEHQWRVYAHDWQANGGWKVINTEQMAHYARTKQKKVFIPLLSPPEIDDKKFSVDPYILGLFLGDGGLTHNYVRFTKGHDYFSPMFDSLIESNTRYERKGIEWYFHPVDASKPWLRDKFRDMDLMEKQSFQKEIPEEYMRGSAKQRLALINGLLDTDGTIDKRNAISFTSTSEKLALQFQELVRSLGDMAYIGTRITQYTYLGEKKDGRRSWTVHIRSKNPGQYFTFPSKKERVSPVNQYSETLKLRVEFVEPDGCDEATCISVDHPDRLFVIQDYIVTHNTYGSLMLMAMRQKKITLIFSPNNATETVWAKTLGTIEGVDAWIYGMVPETTGKTHFVFNHENTGYAKSLIDEIIRANPDAEIGIIVDECHKFTELSSQLTNNLIEICRATGAKDIVFMSGTPFKAMGKELLPFIMSTDPTFTAKDEEGFRKIFGVSGNQAREILAARIGRLLFRIDKSEVVNNDVTEYVVKVKIPGGEQFTLPVIRRKMEDFINERHKFYKEHGPAMCDQYLAICAKFYDGLKQPGDQQKYMRYRRLADQIRETRNLREVPDEIKETNLYEKNVILPTLSASDKALFKDVKSVYKYLALKIQGEALGRVLGAERMRCNQAIIQHIDNGFIFSEKAGYAGEAWSMADVFSTSKSKVVMFSDFIEVLRAMEIKMKRDGFSPELVYGDTNKDLSDIVERFARDPKVNPVIATYKSLSTAVPLIMADSAVFLNTPFRDYIMQQTTARVDRLGQKHPVHLYTYQLDTGDQVNISTRSKDIMEWSKKMVDELLGISTPTADVEPLELEYLHAFSKSFPEKVWPIFKNWR